MKEEIIILDTNAYGELLLEENSEELIQKIRTDKFRLIYGVDVIERELEKTPLELKYKGQELRKLLVDLFESLSDKIIKVTPLVKHLAEDYFNRYKKISKTKAYKKVKAKYSEENIKIDFQIIAIASLNSIDIVVSSDTRTMLSQIAKDVYKHINKLNRLRTPKLIEYKKFKEEYLK